MFLWQKRGYNLTFVKDVDTMNQMSINFYEKKPKVMCFDTETTGLSLITDRPFLIGFVFNKDIYIFEPQDDVIKKFYELAENVEQLYAHNAKFDFHMMWNICHKMPIPKIPLKDSLALARLTDYADSMEGIGLGALGRKMIDPTSKFASDVIKTHINEINRKRYKEAKEKLKERLGEKSIGEIWKKYMRRIPYVETEYDEVFDWLDTIYRKPNYEDSYKEKPFLMINYLADDLVINIEIVNRLYPILRVVDPEFTTFNRENELIHVVAEVEKEGLKADIDYLLASRVKLIDYIEKKVNEVCEIVGIRFTTGQHKLIKSIFEVNYGIGLTGTGEDVLEEVIKKYGGDAGDVAERILELRTLNKWLTTYIEGMLKRVTNGRIYTDVNNSGTVTGRVSSNLQQQPKEPLKDENGIELFHPRRVFIADKNRDFFYLDYSAMELRIQAQYTMILKKPDINMCRAYIPLECESLFDGKKYDIDEDYCEWNNEEWVDENDDIWKPVSLHKETTKKAFPQIKESDDDYAHYYALGKKANFLTVYGGGVKAFMDNMRVTREIAVALNKGFYEAFPRVRDYQSWVEGTLYKQGYVPNLLGRRYYMQSNNYAYKLYNYLIQGTGADILKQKEIEIMRFLKKNGHKTRMTLFVHDELQFSVPDNERYIIPELKRIMEDTKHILPNIPLLCEVEMSSTNWAEKEAYFGKV